MDNVGGRKFIAYLLCMFIFVGIFVSVVTRGLLTGENSQSFLVYLIVIQTIFFGGNIAEKFILSKTEKKEEIKPNGTGQQIP